MTEVRFYDGVEDSRLKFAVILSRSGGKQVLCKHRERTTLEIPGGRREPGEAIEETARRELREETGAIAFSIRPVCVYAVVRDGSPEESCGMLYAAEIASFETELHSEIEKILLLDDFSQVDWTYPDIQPRLLEEARRRGVWGPPGPTSGRGSPGVTVRKHPSHPLGREEGGTMPSYKLHFISLGCAKNVVNCEQMMSLCQEAGHTLLDAPEGADVVVVNTCGFITSASEEAIEIILQMGQLKKEGKLKRILVSGCMTQRYGEDVPTELPEVDGILGTGSYKDIVSAVEDVMAGNHPRRFDDINAPVDEFGRVLTTPAHYAYLRIAEGCDNWCAFCIIPKLRGRYRSRPMENVLAEARELAERGVKELIVIAQDITRYGTDWDGRLHLADLLEELCRLDFHWIRLHYLYPDQMDGRLIDVIAREEKILKYLDIPLQHCNDGILRRMNRRGDKAYIEQLLDRLRERIPRLVLRTSIITGLPGEGEAEFEELCQFLWDQRMLRAGVFPYSPEEGTPAAKMDRADTEEARRRAELVVDIQSRIMDEWNEEMQGEVLEVLCEGFDGQSMMYTGRSWAESPDIDGKIYFTAESAPETGSFVRVRITGAMDGELTGERVP